MTGNVVALCAGRSAVLPLAGETEVVCAFPANVVIAKMVVEDLWVDISLGAALPETPVGLVGGVSRRRGRVCSGRSGGGRGESGGHLKVGVVGRETPDAHLVLNLLLYFRQATSDRWRPRESQEMLGSRACPQSPLPGVSAASRPSFYLRLTTDYSPLPLRRSLAAP